MMHVLSARIILLSVMDMGVNSQRSLT